MPFPLPRLYLDVHSSIFPLHGSLSKEISSKDQSSNLSISKIVIIIIIIIIMIKGREEPGMEVHSYNPSHSGGRDRRITNLRLA
jgi:hypothetical protein